MKQYAQMIHELKTPVVMKQLNNLYGVQKGMLVAQTTRYTRLLKRHEELIGSHTEDGIRLISAPGRAEIGGNHTDHNMGKVLTAAVNLDTVAAVTIRGDQNVNVYSEGYAPLTISLDDLAMRESELGTTAALIRGVAAKLQEEGLPIGGFDAVVTSTVKGGSGLSSSAAFEVMICAIFDELYGGNRLDKKHRAKICQYAENVYFGKPSGLLDQMASSVGGLAYIDFQDKDPQLKEVHYDFTSKGYSLVVVNTGGDHGDLTASYTDITTEMAAVAACFGEKFLRPVQPERFYQSLPAVREELKGQVNADRAIMRASHYFEENHRVAEEFAALKEDDISAFLSLIIQSGRSSFCYLQNVFASPKEQQLSLALMLAEHTLRGKGAWRVHGGGFAGTTLNFVPHKELESFVRDMDAVFGAHSCQVLSIRPIGPACVHLKG
ncbi:MAG: galactokinase [Clostridiales bacterium]|nr:galactokinase [Clostridiales bacterium]